MRGFAACPRTLYVCTIVLTCVGVRGVCVFVCACQCVCVCLCVYVCVLCERVCVSMCRPRLCAYVGFLALVCDLFGAGTHPAASCCAWACAPAHNLVPSRPRCQCRYYLLGCLPSEPVEDEPFRARRAAATPASASTTATTAPATAGARTPERKAALARDSKLARQLAVARRGQAVGCPPEVGEDCLASASPRLAQVRVLCTEYYCVCVGGCILYVCVPV